MLVRGRRSSSTGAARGARAYSLGMAQTSAPAHTDARLRRAYEWRDRTEAAICDEIRPWEHGTVLRASRYPTYYRYNFIRIAADPELGAADLAHVADEALDGLEHRRLDFDWADAGEAVRGELHAAGWRSMRSILMRHEAGPEPGAVPPGIALEEVPYDDVRALRDSWHAEDFDQPESDQFHAAAKEVAESHGARVFAVRGGNGEPVAFAQLETTAGAAEIAQVYVLPGHRGSGLGTAITSAAIAAAGDVEDLWISADDEDRPKELYGRLGFRPLWATMEFLLLP